ncbi:N-acetylornithine carbamoyltransferase [Kamptonema cortianum]|nr:N-acetylornithine carbamoyltransferase [Geitlerinema splendidum]MDK3156271.1 N-acetylornithine carbamoyltransferase [Kamptonema cortianum]
MRHILKPSDLTFEEIRSILNRAAELKTRREPAGRSGLRIGGLFFNPSLRTRVSWEQAAHVLGGHCQTLNASSDSWALEFDPDAVMDGNTVECIVEAAGVLGRYFHILGVRAFPSDREWSEEKQEPVLTAFTQHTGTPIVSLEGSMHHPCQSLADQLTMQEHFGEDLGGLNVTLSWAWHPNPLPMAVPNSFALQAAISGCNLTIACPPGYELDEDLMDEITTTSSARGGSVRIAHDQKEGLSNSQVVYMKSWGRKDMWQDKTAERESRKNLRHWILNDDTWSVTDNAKVMHCLPVRRNVVISSSILDSPRSIVKDEAENRLWAQAALIEFLAIQEGVL